MKRSDLTTRMVLHVVQHAGVNAWEVLSAACPEKVVLAAIQREVDADRLDYGVALHRPFLTDKGRAWLTDATHPWQEYNAHGNTCHWPGCRLTEDEHGVSA